MNPVRATTLFTIYRAKLTEHVLADPEKYRYPVESVAGYASRVEDAVRKHGANIADLKSPALQATLKALDIKRTYKALTAYLDGADPQAYRA